MSAHGPSFTVASGMSMIIAIVVMVLAISLKQAGWL